MVFVPSERAATNIRKMEEIAVYYRKGLSTQLKDG
jgi:hypothetical protein